MDDHQFPRLYRQAVSIEGNAALDAPVKAAEAVASRLIPDGPVRSALGGRWLGHALHPMLTDFPLGTWMSASLLDLVGGPSSRTASRRLVTFGVAAALPTVASGWTDWLAASPRERRVGVVHAAINSTALALYASSLVARRREHHATGVVLGLAGGVAATAGGFLGGHLSLARDTGMRSTRAALFGASRVPADDQSFDLQEQDPPPSEVPPSVRPGLSNPGPS
jgi:uncharacterized membrane protein